MSSTPPSTALTGPQHPERSLRTAGALLSAVARSWREDQLGMGLKAFFRQRGPANRTHAPIVEWRV